MGTQLRLLMALGIFGVHNIYSQQQVIQPVGTMMHRIKGQQTLTFFFFLVRVASSRQQR